MRRPRLIAFAPPRPRGGPAPPGIGTLASAAALSLSLTLAGGCAKEIAVPNLPAMPVAAAPEPTPPPPPVVTSLPASAAPPIEGPLTPAPPLTPRPLITTPPMPAAPRPAPQPQAPAPPPPQVATAPPPAPPRPAPVLSPHVGTDEERRLVAAAQTRIDDADRVMGRIDQKKLGKRQLETLTTIQSFIVKAREAIGARDFERAYTLADKAHVLAEEITTTPR